jgi:hypothetical protein
MPFFISITVPNVSSLLKSVLNTLLQKFIEGYAGKIMTKILK